MSTNFVKMNLPEGSYGYDDTTGGVPKKYVQKFLINHLLEANLAKFQIINKPST